MAKVKTVKRVVTHPNFYMAVDGELQRMPTGTEVVLPVDVAARHAGKLRDPKATQVLTGGELSSNESDGLVESLAEAQDEAKTLRSKLAAVTKRNVELEASSDVQVAQNLGAELAKAQDEIKKLRKKG